MYDVGKNEVPFPPRSLQSLSIQPHEPLYVTPNRVPNKQRFGEFMSHILTHLDTYCTLEISLLNSVH